MISLREFKRLSMEQKNEEILRKVYFIQFVRKLYNSYIIIYFTMLVFNGQ